MKNRNHAGKAAREVIGARGKDNFKHPKRNKNIDEDAPTKEKMKPAHSWKYTETRLYQIMDKFLKSRVGREWDKVYSEINAKFNTQILREGYASTKEFISTYVEENVIVNDDGEVFNSRGEVIKRRGYYSNAYYVLDGILYKSEETPYKYKKPKHGENLKTLDGKDYFYHDGLWWRVRLRPLPERQRLGLGNYGGFQNDEFFGPIFRQSDYFFTCKYGKPCYTEWKQQANSKEVKKLK